ncbi:hypothetical protein [Rhodopseudomonas palustris]|uniref:hypothetical protein n=1 Tax=Rhodopseudomonas palustris TaxID=1076 RepID=UPI000D20696D|nr:hypothetical protein [Rhodopseudomonas palustris]AVT83661.1 hypothetical protein RPYSC3_48010 [Rhodopseudomonas palustris]
MVEAVTPMLQHLGYLREMLNMEGGTANAQYIGAIKDRMHEVRESITRARRYFHVATPVECHNLVVDAPDYGLDMIIQRLCGINTYSLNLDWIEIGTGSTAPTVNDNALTTSAARFAIMYQEDYGATNAIVQGYIADANLPNATYAELGTFCGGDTTPGSGQMFNHGLLSPTYGKTSGMDTTLEVDFNIVNV